MRTSTQLPTRSALLAGLVSVLAACAGRRPAPEPADRPAPTPTDTPAPPVEVPVVIGPAVAFGYSSGTQRYAVLTTATVELTTDSTPVQTDSLVTRAYVTFVLGGGGAGQSVGGAVDSLFVSSRRAPGASQAVTVAAPFTGTLTTAGVRFASDSAPPARCTAGSADALLGVAREVLVALPPSLAEGATWRDSSTTTTCRGNVPTATSTVHEYRVTRVAADSAPDPAAGPAADPAARTATIERVSRSAISGQGSSGSAGTTLTGTAAGQGRFTFDLAAGRYVDGEITSSADLAVSVDGRAQRLTQRGVTRVTLVPPAR